jgi:membrane fusion protein, multidrug efflux system
MLSACGDSHPQGDPAAPTPKVTVVTLKSQPVPFTWELPGRTSAFLVAEVRPQVDGIVKRRLFEEGSYVKAGQPLYELDDAPYRAQYESALANLHKAEATLHAAQLAANRSRELVSINAVSAQDHEATISAEAQAKADMDAARAAVDSALVNVRYAHIEAPISGRIGKSGVTQGALVTANQAEPLALVQQLDPMYVEVNQSSSRWLSLKQAIDAGRLHTDHAKAPVKLLLENGSTYDQVGSFQFSDVTVDPATGNFLLRAVVPNPKELLLPGMYVQAVITQGVTNDGLLVPQQGVTHDATGAATALVVGKDNKVEQRTVHVLRAIGNQWLVDDGVAAGDKVIVEGLQSASPGTVVQAVEQGAAEPAMAEH